jgi:hypothetical protein
MVSWFSSSWQHGLIGTGFGRVLYKWEGERERGRIARKMFQKLLLPCLYVRRGEDHA